MKPGYLKPVYDSLYGFNCRKNYCKKVSKPFHLNLSFSNASDSCDVYITISNIFI